MATMRSKFKYMYDAAPIVALIAKDHVAKTASFNGIDHTLDAVQGYWTNGELADFVFAVAVNVEAIDTTTGDETYTLVLEFGNAGFAQVVDSQTIVVKKAGQYAFLVDMDTIVAQLPTVSHVRIKATLAGTTPSITLHSWIAGDIVDAD